MNSFIHYMLLIYTVDCSITCETDSDDDNGSSMLTGENYNYIWYLLIFVNRPRWSNSWD